MKRRGFLALLGAAMAAPATVAEAIAPRSLVIRDSNLLAAPPADDLRPGWWRGPSGILLQWGTAGAGGYSAFPLQLPASGAHCQAWAVLDTEGDPRVAVHEVSVYGITVACEGANWLVLSV